MVLSHELWASEADYVLLSSRLLDAPASMGKTVVVSERGRPAECLGVEGRRMEDGRK